MFTIYKKTKCKSIFLHSALLFLIFIMMSSFLSANLQMITTSAEEFIRMGVQEYQNNNFERALENFLIAEKTGIKNPDLLYNIGNSYFRLNNIPYAIIYYKRALLLDSSHKDARDNLSFALSITRDRQVDLEENFLTTYLTTAFYYLSINHLFILCLIVLGLIVFFVHLQWRFFDRDNTVLRFVNVLLLFVLMGLTCLTVARIYQVNNNKEAVVIENTVHVYSGPSESFTRLFTIHEGTVLKIHREDNSWTQITTLGGFSGWIVSDTYVRIVEK